jgi:TonB family protein
MANHTILIIDYEPRNVEAASRPLEKAGYKVATAADGVAGMKAFESLNPSLVLIEAMLPKKHGFEVCQEIKKTTHGKRTPVVITTAVYRGRKYRTQALHIYGADEYLEKPFTSDQLLEVCFRFLGEPPGAVPEADESQRRIAVNETTIEPPMASAPPTTPAPPTQAPGAFSKIVGDLTEDEITARLDAILPGELTDLAEDGVIAADPAPDVPEPTDEMPAGLVVVDDLPPDFGGTFFVVEQPAIESPVETPPVIEPEPEQPQHHEESGAAADVVPEQPPEQPLEEPAEEPPEETSEAEVEKKTVEKEDEVAEESDDPSHAVELEAGRGRKRRRKSKKKKRVTRAESSRLAAADQAADADPASTPAPEATADASELETAAEQPTEAQAEQTAAEETVDEPRNEMDELADVVSAAIDQMQVFDEPETEEPTVDEPAADEAASVGLAVEGAAADEPAAEVTAEQEAVPETDTLEEVPTKAWTEPTPGRKTGLWIGVAAAVFVGLAVTMFFVFRDGAEGTNTAGAMPEVTPAPAKVRTTTPSPPARNESSANAAMVMGPGAGNSAPEPATTVKAAVPTAKPEPPVVEPTPPPETETTAAEAESAPVVPETDETTKEPTAASGDDATEIEEIETLAPAVIAPRVEDPTAGSARATVTDSESVDLDPEPAVETTTQVEESLPEPAAAFHDDVEAEPEPALENEPIVDEPTPVAPRPEPKAATGDLVPLHLVDQQPTALDQPRPLYPVSARRLRQEGTVVLNVLVDENGVVTEVEMIRGVSEELDGAAIRAVKGWSYKPARKDGANVKVWKPEKVAFKL